MRRRLGCLTTSGILAAVSTLVILVAAMLVFGGRPFSPGPLNAIPGDTPMAGVRSHSETGGRCAACHPAFWSGEAMADRCLVCHVEVKSQLAEPDSLHGALMNGGKQGTCRDCHSEHLGSDASLTRVDPETFPHEATGFALEGHERRPDGRSFSCDDCHGADVTRLDPAACFDCHGELDRTYMGAHRDAFGSACLGCHDGLDTYGKRFDHDQTVFPLDGGHVVVACDGCHPGARSIADLQTAPTHCYDCHQGDDAHDGQFGQGCGACHTPDGWEDASFDHDQAAFALTGRHRDVECVDCHVENVYLGTPMECVDCHRDDDAHEGQFGHGCVACHTPDGWEDAGFDHDQAAFVLTGAHDRVDCLTCHGGGVFRGTPATCVGCHEEPLFHGGLLGTACADCHSTDAWTPASFDRAHTFPLNHGEAGANACRTCHPSQLATYSCYGCHEHDPVEIDEEHREEGINDFQDCVRCHPTGLEDGEEGDD